MRFPTAWADVATQNVTLRGVIVALSFSVIVLATLSVKLGLRGPLLIERGCLSQVAPVVPTNISNEEIEAFLKEAIPMRFSTSVQPRLAFLSPSQANARTAEQSELNRKGMRQSVFVNAVTFKGNSIQVDSDRLISVEKVRSALPFPLLVNVEKTQRSEDNPYGLVLTNVIALQEKENHP